MPIIYSVVARGSTLLAEFAAPRTGNVPTVAKDILSKLSGRDDRRTYTADTMCFHCLVTRGITFLCVADQEFGSTRPFGFLQAVSQDFMTKFGDRATTAGPLELNDLYSRTLSKQMEYYSNDPSVDKIKKVSQQIDEVKTQMVHNIDRVLARGELIEELVDKTAELDTQAASFKYQSVKLKKFMWWKNKKLWIILVVVLIIIAYIILASACGGLGIPKCLPKPSNNTTPVAAPAPFEPVPPPLLPPAPAPVPVTPPVPVEPPTSPPHLPPVAPPFAAPVQAPIAAPVNPPVQVPIAAPVSAPVSAPVGQPTAAPVQAPAAAPVQEPFASPTAEAPVAEPVSAPVEAPQSGLPPTAPVASPTSSPIDSAPITAPVETPSTIAA